MCPVCLTSLAITVASTAGAGGAVTALALRVKRSLTRDRTDQRNVAYPPTNSMPTVAPQAAGKEG
jgi:hypothetical protein